jgi:hypothetical protein
LKFSDPYDVFGLAFWSPLHKEGTKKFVCGPAFGASLFCFYFGALFLGALDSLEPRVVWISFVAFSHMLVVRRKKKPVVPVPDRPYFFLPTLLFFQEIDHATIFSLGGCGLLPKWRRLSH